MMRSSLLLVAVPASHTLAQRPSNTSICDYYSNALLGASNGTTQKTLLTLVVNTAIIGNYTTPNVLAVPGILASNATYNGTKVNLLQYFDGSLKSTNVGKAQGVSVNFLDGGGAKPLAKSMPGAKGSHQAMLLEHLYSFFGLLLGCSDVAKPGFPAYRGDKSMYEVHKFMALDAYQVQYFIEQVGLSAASFGVTTADVEAVGHAIQSMFGVKCAPKFSVAPGLPPALQSICIASDCPESPNATCSAYGQLTKPAPTPASSSPPASSSGAPGNGSGMPTPSATNGAVGLGASLWSVGVVIVVGFVGMMMV